MTRETRAGPVETSVLAVSSDASSRAKRASAREASTMTRTAAASNGGYSRMRRDGARRGAKARGEDEDEDARRRREDDARESDVEGGAIDGM